MAAKKTTARKKSSTRKYSKAGGNGKKVTSRKQAIAIGLSEARREGDDA